MKRKLFALFGSASILAATAAHAAVDAAVDTAITDQTSLFTDVKTYILAVVVFMLAVGLLKKLRQGS